MPDIIITEFMDDAPVADLEEKFQVHRDDDLWQKPDALVELVRDARALIVRNKTQVTAELLTAAPDLKVIGRLGVGLDNIDLDTCVARNVTVCPATGANAAAVAEYVVTSAMVLLRGAYMATCAMTDGAWPRAELGNGREIAGCTAGIVGFGDIGQQTAARFRALGATVIACDANLPQDHPAWHTAEQASLDDLCKRADVISLHVPLLDSTRNLFDRARLASMKSQSVLINTARGGVVDEHALADAMRDGHLAGSALDVFESEPPSSDIMERFSGLPNVILTPHIAGLSADANTRVSRLTVDNVLSALAHGDT